jgi:hypothetical protein
MQRLHNLASLFVVARAEAFRSLHLNLVPGLLLQGVMIALAAAYFLSPRIHGILMDLGSLKEHWGLLFSFVGTSLASSFLPEALRPLLPKSARPAQEPPLISRLLFAIPFWGIIGMQVDLFYRLQFLMFGPSDRLSIIMTKVLVDAFVYCPLLAIPEAVCIFLWKDHQFTHHGFKGWTPLRFYALKIFPVLMTNWMVWIPVVSVIYSLPSALGIPLFIIAQAFWVMVFTTLSGKTVHRHQP